MFHIDGFDLNAQFRTLSPVEQDLDRVVPAPLLALGIGVEGPFESLIAYSEFKPRVVPLTLN